MLFISLAAAAKSEVVEEDNNYRHTYDRFTKVHVYAWRSDYQELGTDDKLIAELVENPLLLATQRRVHLFSPLYFATRMTRVIMILVSVVILIGW
ncbi:MAG: hypothetical protein ACTTGU_07655 [Moraxella sp.]